jgi:hypothetical protein
MGVRKYSVYNLLTPLHTGRPIEEFFNTERPTTMEERQVKVFIKNLASFFLFPSKVFLPIQNSVVGNFCPKQKEQRQKQL